jgi:hypothetical protein
LIYAFSSLHRIPTGSHKLGMNRTGDLMTIEPTGEPTRVRKRRPQSPETREKIRMSLLGRKHSDERRENNRRSHIGRPLSDEHCAACSRAQLGRVVTDETRRKISAANLGRKQRPLTRKERIARSVALKNRVFTEQHRENLSVHWNRTLFRCPHCSRTAYPPQYGRWHGDRCRKRGEKKATQPPFACAV